MITETVQEHAAQLLAARQSAQALSLAYEPGEAGALYWADCARDLEGDLGALIARYPGLLAFGNSTERV